MTQLPYSDQLNIGGLSRIFDNKSECYKLFWFQAILNKIEEGKNQITFEELIDEMIAEAWYMVSEYHLNLGPKDNLEFAVDYIAANTQMKSSERKDAVLSYLKNTDDKKVREYKQKLTYNVPYRLQAPFLDFKTNDWNTGTGKLVDRINEQDGLLYYFENTSGLNTEIKVVPEWIEYIRSNKEILEAWVKYNMITYLQKRNPSVPGISDKLSPPIERNLKKVIKYWKIVSENRLVKDIYGNEIITDKNISIDHFVPWSYVAHDELWNLHPTTKTINSSKSNNLPIWDMYFPRLCETEYASYQLVWESESVHKEFDACVKDHVNSDEIRYRLYREGLDSHEFANELKSIIYPVYCSAQNCGFKSWEYSI